MTRADVIRKLSDEQLIDLLVWGMVLEEHLDVPSCDEGCPDYKGGCANGCPYDKQEKAVREWLAEEVM